MPSPALLDLLIADDHTIVRRGLRFLLDEHLPQASIREVESFSELLERLEERVPDLLILDLQLTDRNTFGAIGRLRAAYPSMRILVFTMTSARIFADTIMRAGVNGFLNKQCTDEDIIGTVKRILAETPDPAAPPVEMPETPLHALSMREINVMHELLTGRSVKEIASRLDIEVTTVATYKRRLFEKLGATSILDLQRMVNDHA